MLPRARSTLKDFETTVSDKDDAHNELLISSELLRDDKPKNDGRMGRIAVIAYRDTKTVRLDVLRASDEG
jgi:hypothetical protein